MTAAVTGPPCFDRLARPYRWLEYLTFGPLLHRCRTYYLAQVSDCRSALVLGDGDGRFTASLLGANPEVQIHAVDGSPAMLQTLRQACRSHAGRVTTEAADLRGWSPAPGTRYDLIASHFFLDCLSTAEIASLAARLQPALHENALWLISDFAIPHGVFGRRFAAPLVALLYRIFGILTGLQIRSLPNHPLALHSAGWSRIALRSHLRGLLISEIWSASPSGREWAPGILESGCNDTPQFTVFQSAQHRTGGRPSRYTTFVPVQGTGGRPDRTPSAFEILPCSEPILVRGAFPCPARQIPLPILPLPSSVPNCRASMAR